MPNATQCDAPAREALRSNIASRTIAQRQILIQRIRRRLDARTSTRSDPEDVFSTTLRRLDALAASGDLVQYLSDEHLLALATAIAHNAVRERTRKIGREQLRLRTMREALHGANGAALAASPDRTLVRHEERDADRAHAEVLLGTLLASDVEILGLRLRGSDWPTIAAELRTTPGAAHRRYFRALRKLASLGGESDSTAASTSSAGGPTAASVADDAPGSLP